MVDENEITAKVIGEAIEVHRHLGPGLLESACEEDLLPIHKAQLLTYLNASNAHVGLLINFNVPILINGLKRMMNHHIETPPDASPRSLSDLGVSALNRKAH